MKQNKLLKKLLKTIAGDPSSESTTMGPVVSDLQYIKFRFNRKGIEEGAELVVGGPENLMTLIKAILLSPLFLPMSNA